MSVRTLTPEIVALIQGRRILPALFIFADFPSGARRIWTGIGTYSDDYYNEYIGVGGGLISLENISETVDSATAGMRATLNGLDSTLVAQLVNDDYQGAEARVDLGFWDPVTYAIHVLPLPFWRGVLDTDSVKWNGDSVILQLMAENRQTDILRKRNVRYNGRDQRMLYPGVEDTGFDHLPGIMDISIPWGRAQK